MTRPNTEQLRALDRAARLSAQREFGPPLVLEAGAGTGKTTALVARIACWTLGPGWERAHAREPEQSVRERAERVLERVVAITFTEAAAAQMAERVGQALAGVQRGEAVLGLEEEALPPPPERRARAAALLGALDHLVVRTIHAFCRRLLASYPLEAGLHPAFEVDAEGTQRDQVIREVVEARMRSAYTDDNSDWLALASSGIGPVEIEQALAALVLAGLPASELARDPFEPARVQALVAELRAALAATLDAGGRRLDGVRGSVTAGTHAALLESERLLSGEIGNADALARTVPKLAELWPSSPLGRLGKWRRHDFTGGETSALAELAEAFSASMDRLVRLLKHAVELDPAKLERARRTLQPLLAGVESELHARGVASFDDLLVRARDLVLRREDVAARVRRGIDQLLVDEFQDTDRTQCALVAELALRGPEHERPGLFVVGDPKQSIYGWRSADLRAYEEFVSHVLAGGGRLARLSTNFRSVPPVLDEVERVMSRAMRREPGLQPEFEPLAPSERRERDPLFEHGRARPIEYWVSWRRGRRTETASAEAAELEARAVASEIRRLHDEAGVPWREFGLLFRSRGDYDVYLGELRDAGVPYAVQGERSYYQRREVIEAAALLRCVLDPHDHLSLLTALRSAWVGVPDAALIPLWVRQFPARVTRLGAAEPEDLDALRALVREAAAAVPEGVPGLERVAGWELGLLFFLEKLAQLRRSFRRDPADRFVEALRRSLLLEPCEAARYQGTYRLANLDVLFRQLARDLSEAELGSQALLRALRKRVAEALQEEEGRPKEASDDAVQIHTIHQAKGLDFRHVYLLQLHRGSGGVRSKQEPDVARRDAGWEYRLFGAPTPGMAAAVAERQRVERAELVRTLYVGMTRAADRLVLCALWKRDGGYSAEERTQRLARASAHSELLAARDDVPELGRLAESLDPTQAWADAGGVRWVFPDFASEASAPARDGEGHPGLASPEQVRAESERIAARSEAARARMLRPLGGAASAEAHRALREQREARAGDDDARARRSRTAQHLAVAVGSAVHAALEQVDLAAEPEREAARLRESAGRVLASLLSGAELERAREQCEQTLARFASGPLFARLRALEGRVLARELDLIAPPGRGDHAPLSFESGAIDLLYRDPDDERLVVADYKTDRPSGAREFAERIAAYRSQGQAYTRAVRGALALDYTPRFELWFLESGRVEVPAATE